MLHPLRHRGPASVRRQRYWRDRAERAEALLDRGVVAMDLTRQYVGYKVLPEREGWSWFDWVTAVQQNQRARPLPIRETNGD